MKTHCRIVVLDDQEDSLLLMEHVLKKNMGHTVISFKHPNEAIDYLKNGNTVDLLCTDLRMPGMDGLQVINSVKQIPLSIPIIVITASDTLDDALRALRSGAFDYIVKPIDPVMLDITVERALKVRQLEKERNDYFTRLEEINNKNQKELDMGRNIQQKMLPSIPTGYNHFRFGLTYLPSNKIGGDFFDFLSYRETYLTGIWLADVSGHGIPAALLTMLLKTELRAALRDPTNLPANIRRVNNRLNKMMPPGKFASTFIMLVDDEKKMITYCKCSQEPALLIHPDGGITELHTNGILLGSFGDDFLTDELSFDCETVPLRENEKIVLYTDGITEAVNPGGEMFTRKRMINTILDNFSLTAQELCDTMRREVLNHTGKDVPDDDVTMIILDVV